MAEIQDAHARKHNCTVIHMQMFAHIGNHSNARHKKRA